VLDFERRHQVLMTAVSAGDGYEAKPWRHNVIEVQRITAMQALRNYFQGSH
jgi:hypothetical protein